jgi:protein SCO1/2
LERDRPVIRTTAASLVITLAGGALFWCGTDGFRALTSEQARRAAIAAAPRTLPAVELEDQDGKPFTLAAYRGRPVVVDFVYTECTLACPLLSDAFQRLDRAQQATWGRDDDRRLPLVSITFDPLDTPSRLRTYAGHYEADGRVWRFARARNPSDLASLLRAFDVVVIPDGRGGFQHNAAVHVVDARGRLARVLDLGVSPQDVADVARATAEEPSR